MKYKVKEVADLAGVSVRTLHYYDEIGLLKPESVSPAGYRLYSERDLERLQQILFFTELGFSLSRTKSILERPDFDRKKALLSHKELLIEKKKRLERMIASVDKTLETLEGGAEMSKKEMFEAFDMSEIERNMEKYAEEAEQKYGGSKAYEESMKRAKSYTKEDWARIMHDADRIYKNLASLVGRDPADPEVQKAIGEWRQHISNNFYECTLEIFRGLGDLYVDDVRFTQNIDKYKPGLAAFMREAMHIYCDNMERARK